MKKKTEVNLMGPDLKKEWTCPHCGAKEDFYFDRSLPMCYRCNRCGRDIDKTFMEEQKADDEYQAKVEEQGGEDAIGNPGEEFVFKTTDRDQAQVWLRANEFRRILEEIDNLIRARTKYQEIGIEEEGFLNSLRDGIPFDLYDKGV